MPILQGQVRYATHRAPRLRVLLAGLVSSSPLERPSMSLTISLPAGEIGDSESVCRGFGTDLLSPKPRTPSRGSAESSRGRRVRSDLTTKDWAWTAWTHHRGWIGPCRRGLQGSCISDWTHARAWDATGAKPHRLLARRQICGPFQPSCLDR